MSLTMYTWQLIATDGVGGRKPINVVAKDIDGAIRMGRVCIDQYKERHGTKEYQIVQVYRRDWVFVEE